jgi:primosomal protein N'
MHYSILTIVTRKDSAMHIVSIIPIARGIPFDTLSYFNADFVRPGTIVDITIGRQVIPGIVTNSQSAIEVKTAVKQASFSLKKIKAIRGHAPFFEHIAHALKETSARTLTPIGAIAANVIPSFLFEYITAEKMFDQELERKTAFKKDTVFGTRTDRLDYYKRVIRTAFAEKKSVLFIAPTIRSVLDWKTQLEKGIGKHVVILHSKVTKRDLRSYFSLIKSPERPLVIFTTPAYAGVIRNDIGLMVLEDESSNLYKTNDRFETDLRIFFEQYAQELSVPIIFGDTLPRFETLEQSGKTHMPRTFVPDKLHIVPIEQYKTILPSEVVELIRHAEKKKRKLFIYTNRKGVAPLSRCGDCGTIVTCQECSLPMVLRNKITANEERERYFLCTHCGFTLPANYTCSHCDSWNIVMVSIGTESIRDAVSTLIGEEAVITIDHDLTPDSTVITSLIEKAHKMKFVVVIGTVKVLPYLKNIHYTILPFFDRLLSIPSLYTTEEALRLVMECNERSSDGVIVCTKTPTFPLLKQLETKKINAIIFDELTVRKELGYPPYGTIIKVGVTVPEGHKLKVLEQLQHFLDEEKQHIEYSILPARRISQGSMKVLLNWIIKTNNSYIEEEGSRLLQALEALRFPYKVEQNPERL